MKTTSSTHYTNHKIVNRSPGHATARISSMAVITLAVCLFLSQDASAVVRWVDNLAASLPPGTGCGPLAAYKTIQDAVNAASAGDTIMVCAGVYPEPAPGPLTINKPL